MGRPAVPRYLDKHLLSGNEKGPPSHVSPGLRFSLLFPFWNEQGWGPDSQNKSKTNALRQVLPMSIESRELLEALYSRQKVLAERLGDVMCTTQAVSTAPFVTGIGNEHPLENGFSFLNPYGLPYLPGSAVKGILRRAAEELSTGRFEDDTEWQPLYVWLLFGFDAGSGCFLDSDWNAPDPVVREIAESQQKAFLDGVTTGRSDGDVLRFFMERVLSREALAGYGDKADQFLLELTGDRSVQPGTNAVERKDIHYRGALSFWDVFPIPPVGSKEDGFLRMEILTPHYSEYYQEGASPADCGQPVPNPFLTVAPACRYTFHVQCESARLPRSLRENWRPLLRTAFRHAFDWLGFGAKTAVGYGQMAVPFTAGSSEEKPSSISTVAPIAAPPAPSAGDVEIWDNALLSWKKSDQSLIATHPDGRRKSAPWKSPDRSKIPDALHQVLFEAKKPKPVYAKVRVAVKGNDIRIEAIELVS